MLKAAERHDTGTLRLKSQKWFIHLPHHRRSTSFSANKRRQLQILPRIVKKWLGIQKRLNCLTMQSCSDLSLRRFCRKRC